MDEKCKEYWKPVKGWEEFYEISNYSRIRSLANPNRIKTKTLDKDGYERVELSKPGFKRFATVHRLVAESFLSNPNNLPVVNHKDEDKTNNFVWINEDGSIDPEKSNLEWCTVKYNTNYGSGTERRAKKRSKPVLQFDLQGQFVKEWKSLSEIERQLGYNIALISRVCNGKPSQKTAYGFKWMYA